MKYLAQRILFYLVTAWAAITVNFFIPRLIPGDPVEAILGRFQGQISTNAMHSLYVLFGLDKHESLWHQYVQYLGQLLHGNLGLSFTFFPTPVSTVLRQALPWTLILVGTTTILSFLIGTSIGVIAGWKRGSWVDGALPLTTFLSSIPFFWLGLIAIYLFTGPGSWFPSANGFAPGEQIGWNSSFIFSAISTQHPARADDPGHHDVRMDPHYAQHDGDGLGRGLHHGRAREGPVRTKGDVELRAPATRCSRTCPASRCRSGSSSAAHSSSRSCSPTPASAMSCCRPSVRMTIR